LFEISFVLENKANPILGTFLGQKEIVLSQYRRC